MMKIEDINNLPVYQKGIALALVVVIIFGGFYITISKPKNIEITSLEGKISKVQNEINVNKTKARKLEELIKENNALERQLAEKKQQLPSEAEVETLLKQVSEIGLRVGLDFNLWRPGDNSVNSSKLYVEIPVHVEITGDYHLIASFFDRVGKLPRIVNIEDIKMSSPRLIKEQVVLKTRFVATAFASYDEPVKSKPAESKK